MVQYGRPWPDVCSVVKYLDKGGEKAIKRQEQRDRIREGNTLLNDWRGWLFRIAGWLEQAAQALGRPPFPEDGDRWTDGGGGGAMSAWREVKDWCMQTKWHHHPGRCSVAQHADLSKSKSGQRGEKGDVYGADDRGPIYITQMPPTAVTRSSFVSL